MYNQYGTSTGLPVLKIVIMPDICQYRTSTKYQHRKSVRDQHWSASAKNRYHARHMPVRHQYQIPAPITSTGPALTDQYRTSLSSPTYASAGTSTVFQHCARTCQYGRSTAPVVNFLLGFYLGGYVNKQNCRIWDSKNPKMIIENPLYPQRITVWYGFWARGIIEPYFFENEAGVAVWVNGLRYWTLINEFLWPELEDIDVDDVYLQQDGATCHTNCKTICLSRGKFPG